LANREGYHMHFIIHCIDRAGAQALRAQWVGAHREYLARRDLPVRVLVSGPLIADADDKFIGSFFLVEAPDRDAVNRFREADPLKQADIWEREQVDAFLKRQDVR
jgi:uncharacterized protein